ncbi:hypothetical protein B0J11DRAFT_594153 [Dendryphion nanum]|uniref:DUF7730 domain-containing protein n=1 Tax=Dendryphion nanum TaxID=256645 RepID=A0A9P9D9P4_9PLEO|nr:hypothetical protein B0J11DRAFT_594153 [Dendryphion nanum]
MTWKAATSSPQTLLKTIKGWHRQKPKERVVAYLGNSNTKKQAPLVKLPPKRKRALSIDFLTPPSTLLGRLLSGTDSKKTHSQGRCLLLTKIPPELRNIIYSHVLGSRVIHIIPSLVPSRTKPNNKVTTKHLFFSRLDHEPCKQRCNPKNETGLLGYNAHSSCAIWVNREGELYFNAPQPVAQSEAQLELRFLRWWSRKNRALSLVKTCRQIYSEAIYILYATNVFDFRSVRTFAEFPATILSKRLSNIRYLHLRVMPIRAPASNGGLDTCQTLETCRRLNQFKGLICAILFVQGEEKDVQTILEAMDAVTGPRRYRVKARWVDNGEEKEKEIVGTVMAI